MVHSSRYAENGSLGQILKAFGKLNERLVASYVVKILEGLHYLHTSDVVHCDLKAANILTTKNGNVKLSDFGVSLNLRAMEREIKDVAGTPNWMAPEVIELKGASTKADIWSLGCTVIELLTGRPPYAEISNTMSGKLRDVYLSWVIELMIYRSQLCSVSLRTLCRLSLRNALSCLKTSWSSASTRILRKGQVLRSSANILGSRITGWLSRFVLVLINLIFHYG